MDKIGLTKLLRAEFGFGLSQAKSITDTVLSGREPSVEIADEGLEQFTARLDELGVNYQIL